MERLNDPKTYELILAINSMTEKLSLLRDPQFNLQKAMDSAVEKLSVLMSIDCCWIQLFDATGNLTVLSHRGLTSPILNELTSGETRDRFISDIMQSGETVIIDDISTHSSQLFPLLTQAGLYSLAAARIHSVNVSGLLVIASNVRNDFSIKQAELLKMIANQISSAIGMTNAEQRARMDELTSLFNRRHFDECLKQEISKHSIGKDKLSLIFIDLDFFKDYNDSYGHVAGDELLRQIAKLIKSIKHADLAFRYGGDEFAIILPKFATYDARLVAKRVCDIIATDMKNKRSQITASIGLASFPDDGTTRDEIVNAADNALYYAKQTGGNRACVVSEMLPQQTNQGSFRSNSEKEVLSIIHTLAATIEARDPYTYGHSRIVSSYAVALAEALRLPSEKVAVVSTAALLHDIGKIGIPDEVLNKTEALTYEESEKIRSHPSLSAAIVGRVSSLTPCLPAILHHHEQWNGQGYPKGLEGESIPIEARILSIADIFDAITKPRPYRDGLTLKEAIEELKSKAGIIFDPNLVEYFIPIACKNYQKYSKDIAI